MVASARSNASMLTSGTLADARLPSTAQAAVLTASYTPPMGTICVALGDSITGNNGGPGPQSGALTQTDSKGYFAWANVLLGHSLTIYNAGKAGDTTAQMLARFAADVTPYSPRFVIILGGTNDMLQDVTSAVTIANLTTIVTDTLAIGATAIVGTIPPNNTATTAQANEAMKVNRWIRDYTRANRGAVLADVGAALYDSATTFKPLVGYTTDGTHPSPPGAANMGRILADALRPFVPTTNALLGTSNGDPTNLLSNPMFNGAGNALATGWDVSGGLGAVTVSYISRTDGVASKRMQLAVPNGNPAVSLQQNVNVDAAALSVGDRCYFAIEFEADTLDPAPAANTQAVRLVLQSYDGAGFTQIANELYWDTSYTNVQFPGAAGTFATPLGIPIPAGSTILQPVIQIFGGGNYRVSRAALRKV